MVSSCSTFQREFELDYGPIKGGHVVMDLRLDNQRGNTNLNDVAMTFIHELLHITPKYMERKINNSRILLIDEKKGVELRSQLEAEIEKETKEIYCNQPRLVSHIIGKISPLINRKYLWIFL